MADDEPPAGVIDAAADAAAAVAEGFESTPLPTGPLASTAVDSPVPSLADAVARVPSRTQALLDELFKARISAVKRIPRDQLR